MFFRAFILIIIFITSHLFAGSVEDQVKSRLPSLIEEIKTLASNPKLIEEVAKYNANPPEEFKQFDNNNWKKLSVRDPKVKALTENEAAQILKQNKKPYFSEAFISAADGFKVAFLSKTSNWNHKGKPKHDVPMQGKVWTGKLELDESTGVQQIQLAVPILMEGKPIGSLVIGIAVAKL